MDIRVDFRSPVPIYRQIVDGFRLAIARDEIRPGDRLPSVRDLATALSINPNTVSSAYREMIHQELAVSRKGVGLFLAEGEPGLPAREKRKRLSEKIEELFAFAGTLGLPEEAVHAALAARKESRHA